VIVSARLREAAASHPGVAPIGTGRRPTEPLQHQTPTTHIVAGTLARDYLKAEKSLWLLTNHARRARKQERQAC